MTLFRAVTDRISGRDKISRNCRHIVKALSRYIGIRSVNHYDNLIRTQQFIYTAFSLHGSMPYEEIFTVDGVKVANVIVDLPGKKYPDHILVIGAHYDTVDTSMGANDNASGIAALLEIHRLISHEKRDRTVRLVAFVLEEPPHYGTKEMGSYVNASRCRKRGEAVDLMIALDMLGYGGRFVKQRYPAENIKKHNPVRGDFLVCTALPSDSHFALLAKKHFNRHSYTRMREMIAPASINGIINSDHYSFYKQGFPAILFTDTGFYRNKTYHTEDDTFDTVNYRFLADNVYAAAKTVRDLSLLSPVHFRKKL